MRKTSLFLLGITMGFIVSAKEDPAYPVSAIPEDMKTGMYAVIREQDLRFEINSEKSATTYSRLVITILNSNAEDCAEKILFMTSLTS